MQETRSGPHGTGKKILGISPKDRIQHSRFGLGTILEIDERYTKIAFDESGTRKFVTSMVKLAPSEIPAPVKSPRGTRKVGRSRRKKPV
jgi:hypothetical protein